MRVFGECYVASIGAPVKGATLIGNGPDVLQRVSMVGNDLKLDGGVGTCGKEGQSVPVGVGQPTLRIDALTVDFDYDGVLTPAENVAKRLWFTRDHFSMAHVLGWGEVAPFYIDLETPVPESGIPKPGPLEVHLKDDHLQYAITWFGLAGAVVIAFGVWMRGQRRA